MIKFFRKIRQQLLSENKFSRYFLYAIGEIILVVLGILIALQINKWNESKIHQQAEITFIKDLKNDLEQDRIRLENCLQNIKKNIIAQDILILELPTSYRDNKVKLDSIFLIYSTPLISFFPVSGTFDASVSNGNMAFFKNKEFISKIYLLYNTKYPRLVYNGELSDNRVLRFMDKYNHERRTKEIGNVNDEQISEILDDIDRGTTGTKLRKQLIKETLDLVNDILTNY